MSATQAKPPARLTDDQLADMMRLIGGADSVELKLTIPEDAHRATISNLNLDPVEAQPRQVFFFDTPTLTLDKAGVVVRARRIQGGAGDTVVKLRPVQPDALPKSVRSDAAFKVEVDAIPGGYVCSGSFKGRTTGKEVRDALAGKLPLKKLFSKAQRAFYAEHAPVGINLDDLVALGPTFILKGTFTPPELDRRFTAEYWLYQDGSRILELSTKCSPKEAFQVAAEARAFLVSKGVSLSGSQQTKTRTALEFFQKQLAEAAKPAATRKPAAARTAAKPAAARTAAKPAARRVTKPTARGTTKPTAPTYEQSGGATDDQALLSDSS